MWDRTMDDMARSRRAAEPPEPRYQTDASDRARAALAYVEVRDDGVTLDHTAPNWVEEMFAWGNLDHPVDELTRTGIVAALQSVVELETEDEFVDGNLLSSFDALVRWATTDIHRLNMVDDALQDGPPRLHAAMSRAQERELRSIWARVAADLRKHL